MNWPGSASVRLVDRRPIVQQLRPFAAVVFAATLLLVSCGDEPPTDYTDQNRVDFLASCADPLTDQLMDIELCQCVFEAVQREIDFDRFVEIEELLAGTPAAPLPAEVVDLVADCVIELADL